MPYIPIKNTILDLSFILNHLGEDRENYQQSVSPPIFQSSNFTFKDVSSMRNSLADELNTPFYTRGCNPTVKILRTKIAALEKAEDALICGSGAAAIAMAVFSQVKSGDHIVCVNKPYSWTNKLIEKMLTRFGITHTYVDGTQIAEFEKAIQDNTTLIYLESPNSLTFELQDIKAVATLARSKSIKTIIDNSYCSPYYQNPIEMGVDIVVHSATKYIAGHSDLVAGVIASSKTIIKQIFESEYMTLGGIISPNDAALLLRSLRTLPIRMEKIVANTQEIVQYLCTHPKVSKIYYPFLKDNPQYELAKSQMREAPGLLSIKLDAPDIDSVERFCNSLDRFLLACSWGGHESLIFPMCVLHDSQNYDESLLPWNFIRFYIGLEEPKALINDLNKAFGQL